MAIEIHRRPRSVLLPLVVGCVLFTGCSTSDDENTQGASAASSAPACVIPNDDDPGVSVYSSNGVTVAVIIASDPNAVTGENALAPNQIVYGQLFVMPNEPDTTLTGTITYRWRREDLPNNRTLSENTTTETVSGCKRITTQIGPLESGGWYGISVDFAWTDPKNPSWGLSAGTGGSFRTT
ncbi:hypothetical protein [Antrihabitans stalactiti]|uniref:Lipoprotein n=1 Tax=Antrihabitans stalactiti TaxID=2584121 RepID=A0A848KSD1_9NOCA|nr:hypothetical protein [Antrihabitans stalactiti]NMN99432.1 hypothetical protein [Antrihabitans stalactiti]